MWSATEDNTPAVDVAAQHRASDDPYKYLLHQKWAAEASSSTLVRKDDSDSEKNGGSELNTFSAYFGSDEPGDSGQFGSDEPVSGERILLV